MAEPVTTTPVAEKSGITAAAAARIAKKNGAAKIGKDAALAMAKKAEEFIAKTTKEAVAVANHAGRKVIRAEDINFVAK
jgi:DNA-binding protein